MNLLSAPALLASFDHLLGSLLNLFGSHLLIPVVAGVIGSFAMATLMLVPARLQMFRVDVVRAVGALVTRDRGNAHVPGMIIHMIMGAMAAVFYKWFFDYMGIPLFFATGLFVGAVHGVLVMLLVSIFVLEHHPMKRYQRRGFGTGFAQIFGHAFFGLIVGTIIAFFTLRNHWWPQHADIEALTYFGK